jgi:TM2 domain-containing membrane protein YozV
MSQVPSKFCYACAATIDSRAEICPKCGVRQPTSTDYLDNREIRDISSTKIAAGVCGILLGGLGVHKFIIGLTMPGVIMLLVSVLTCGFGSIIMGPIGLVEGIIYLTKSDEDFYETYIVEKRGWF